MPTIRVNVEARDALRPHARGELSKSFDLPADAEGKVEMDLSWQTIKRLQQVKMTGETLSDAILRLALMHGRKPN